jgi:hypothetical protein
MPVTGFNLWRGGLVAVVGSRRKKRKPRSGWTWRLAGIALCAFFALGVITGLSESGRVLARRIEALLQRLPHSGRSELIPTAYRTFFFKEPTAEELGRLSTASIIYKPTEAIALAEQSDGFYRIDDEGALLGPVAPADTVDMPILSGSGVEHAHASELLGYTSELIRAEAVLSSVISEMRVRARGEIRLYLDRPHLVIVLNSGQFPLQLARAARVLEVWRAHRELIGMIDMTIPGEAIVRPKAEAVKHSYRAYATGAVRHTMLN